MNDSSPRALRLIVQLADASRRDLRESVETMRNRGHKVEVRVAWEPEDMISLSREACQCGSVRTLVAVGGDGTAGAVAEGILGCSEKEVPSMAILPLGTANDFAQAVGLPTDYLEDALRIAAEIPATPIDTVRANDRFFLNVATAGVGTSVTVDTPEPAKKVLGKVAYLVTGLREIGNVEPKCVAVEAGDLRWEGDFLVLAVGNGRFAGGGFDLCPEARLDDGLMELCVVPDTGPDNRTATLRQIVEGGIQNVGASVVHRRVAGLTIRSSSPLQFNFDGEPVEAREFTFRALPGALRFHLPEKCPLVAWHASPARNAIPRV